MKQQLSCLLSLVLVSLQVFVSAEATVTVYQIAYLSPTTVYTTIYPSSSTGLSTSTASDTAAKSSSILLLPSTASKYSDAAQLSSSTTTLAASSASSSLQSSTASAAASTLQSSAQTSSASSAATSAPPSSETDPDSATSNAEGASGSDAGAFNLSKGGLVAIIVVVVVVVVFGVVSVVLFYLAKKRQWDVRGSLRRASRRFTGRGAAPEAASVRSRSQRHGKPVARPTAAVGHDRRGAGRDLEKGNVEVTSRPRPRPREKSWVAKLWGNAWK